MGIFFASNEFYSLGSAISSNAKLYVSVWYKSNDLSSTNTVFSLSSTSSTQRKMHCALESDGIRTIVKDGAGSSEAVSSISPTENVWQHALFGIDSSTSRFVWLNGGNKGSNTTSRSPSSPNITAIGMERDQSPSNPMEGIEAELVIWEGVSLLDNHAKHLASGFSPWKIFPANILAFYHMFTNGTTLFDYSGNGNNMTKSGTPDQADHAPVGPMYGTQQIITLSIAVKLPPSIERSAVTLFPVAGETSSDDKTKPNGNFVTAVFFLIASGKLSVFALMALAVVCNVVIVPGIVTPVSSNMASMIKSSLPSFVQSV